MLGLYFIIIEFFVVGKNNSTHESIYNRRDNNVLENVIWFIFGNTIICWGSIRDNHEFMLVLHAILSLVSNKII